MSGSEGQAEEAVKVHDGKRRPHDDLSSCVLLSASSNSSRLILKHLSDECDALTPPDGGAVHTTPVRLSGS